MGCVKADVHVRSRHVAAPESPVERLPLGIAIVQHPACFDGRMGSSGRSLDLRNFVEPGASTQPRIDGGKVGACRVAELAGD